MKITKAEILWTRQCNLSCSYCSMASGEKHQGTIEQWQKGFENLSALGCGFAAFYGAEPLIDFDGLPEAMRTCADLDIDTTVITSGFAQRFKEKVSILHEHGLHSLSMSYDVVSGDASVTAKHKKCLPGLEFFKSLGPYRDTAAIATVTAENVLEVTRNIEFLTQNDIWFFFDIIHFDRGQTGSKCKGKQGLKQLSFNTEEKRSNLIQMLEEVLVLKKKGYLCHSSEIYLSWIKRNIEDIYSWNCADQDSFPAWVTVNYDGVVYPCDDFQPRYAIEPIYVWDLEKRWKEFCEYWKPIVQAGCPGCCWNTHIDAHAIKEGKLPFSDYVHRKEKM